MIPSTPPDSDHIRKLIFVRHSKPIVEPDVPSALWGLSGEGRAMCQPLAEKLAGYGPDVLVCSVEPKAVETAEIVAHLLDIPLERRAGLHEHDRSNVGYMQTACFEASVARFFDMPGDLVFGRETADQAHLRFSKAIGEITWEHPRGNVAVVAHGTVMSLFVARATGVDALRLWSSLETPSFVVMALPGLDVLTVVKSVHS